MKRTGKKLASLALALILLLAVLPGGVLAASLTVNSITADKTAPAVGDTITWTATASGGTGSYRYCFYVFRDGKITERGSYGVSNTYSYTPTLGGAYTVRVYVKDSANTTVNKMSAPLSVAFSPITVNVAADKPRVMVNETVRWTATASGGTGSYKYCFYVFKDGKIFKRGSYTASNTYPFTPSQAGKYTVRVYVKDSAGTVQTKEGGQSVAFVPIVVTSLEPLTTWGLVTESTNWEAVATGGTGGLEYNFYLFRGGQIETRSGWQSDPYFSDIVLWPGTYTCRVYVRDKAGTQVCYDSTAIASYGAAEDSTIFIDSLEPNVMEAFIADCVTWTADAHGGFPYNNLQYNFYIFRNGKIETRSGWQSSNTYDYLQIYEGNWTARVYVRDEMGQVEIFNSTTVVFVHGI